MSKLAPLDLSFLLLENSSNQMHMACYQLLRIPARQKTTFVTTLLDAYRNSEVASPFNQQLKWLDHGVASWEQVEPGVEVKLLAHPDAKGTERYVLCRSRARHQKEAAMLRDKIFALERTLEKQVAVTTDFADRDVLGLAASEKMTIVTVMAVRGGLLIGTRHYPFDDTLVPDTEILEAFVRQHYERIPFVPPEICLPVPLESQSMICQVVKF